MCNGRASDCLIYSVSLASLPLPTAPLVAQSNTSGPTVSTLAHSQALILIATAKTYRFPKLLVLEVLVAWAMNGELLTENRGGPVRLVVPGYFGTNSVKWLCRLEIQG